jgi:predicted Fe-Mo cluster-binding NifX family protein
MSAQGLPQNFTVRTYSTFNAEARIVEEADGDKRYLLYNLGFLKQIEESSHTEWGPMGILAHEIAHHLLGHMIEHSITSPLLELEADHFAGFILCRMNATLEQAQSGFSVFADIAGPDSTHPRRTLRLEAVRKGWEDGKSLSVVVGGERTPEEKIKLLIQAADANDVATAKTLIDGGVSVDALDEYQRTPLLSAIQSNVNTAETVSLLLERGANPNLTPQLGSPLYYAVEKNSTRIIKLLIDHHVNVNAQDNQGHNALSSVIQQSISNLTVTPETIALLVKAGINVSQTTGRGFQRTPLHYAVSFNQYEAVKELLKSKTVRVNATDEDGWTPMDHATPRSDIEELLKHAGGRRIRNR